MIDENTIKDAIEAMANGFEKEKAHFSITRDVFTARLEALEIAFTKKISGRSPEQRGNGLKFVSETIQNNNWDLYFQSGKGCCFINKGGIKYSESDTVVSGCLAVINFHGGK